MKAPNLPSLSESATVAAGRADARIGAVLAGREQVRREHVVEHVEHFADADVLDAVDRADEVAPEVAQHLAPVDFAVGDAVEVFLEAGGEFVLDVAGEEVLQERDDDAALVLGVEALLLEPHVVAVLQHLQDRRIGRGTADAELLHALDQRGFREARRRLGEMLRGGDRALRQRLAGTHRGQALAFLVVLRVVLALLIEREEAVELDDRAGRAQVDGAGAGLGGDVDGGALELGRLHLARDRAQPDQLVEPGLIATRDIWRHRAGASSGSDGRIASCASCAFFCLFW